MSIFNSLGSNYDFRFVLKALFSQNKNSYSDNFKSFLEKKYQGKATLVYKGREALSLVLKATRLARGSFVAINSFTCFAVYQAIRCAGYSIELIDLEENTLNFSAKTLNDVLAKNPKIKAVVVQNTLGYPADIEKICQERNLLLIEDLAHCVGTKYEDGREVGTVGDLVVLSFSQDKMIDAVSGGALIIRNRKFQKNSLEKLSGLNRRQQSIDKLYPLFTFLIRKTYDFGLGKIIHFFLKNLNLLSKPMSQDFYKTFSLPNWYCYLALSEFDDLPNNLNHRKKIANIYKKSLNKKVLWENVTKNIPNSSNLRFPIFVDNRRSLINYLKSNKVYISDIWYESVDPSCKISQNVSQRILNLPTHKNISEQDALFISEKINEWIKKNF